MKCQSCRRHFDYESWPRRCPYCGYAHGRDPWWVILLFAMIFAVLVKWWMSE